MPDLPELLDDAIAGEHRALLSPDGAGDVEATAGLFGPGPRAQNPALAAELAGTTSKRRRTYKAALRNVQRWRAGEGRERRHPSAGSRVRLARAARAGVTRALRDGATATIVGLVRVSEDVRERTLRARLSPELIRPTLDAWQRGALEEAGAIFLRDFRRAYSNVPVELERVTAVELEP